MNDQQQEHDLAAMAEKLTADGLTNRKLSTIIARHVADDTEFMTALTTNKITIQPKTKDRDNAIHRETSPIGALRVGYIRPAPDVLQNPVSPDGKAVTIVVGTTTSVRLANDVSVQEDHDITGSEYSVHMRHLRDVTASQYLAGKQIGDIVNLEAELSEAFGAWSVTEVKDGHGHVELVITDQAGERIARPDTDGLTPLQQAAIAQMSPNDANSFAAAIREQRHYDGRIDKMVIRIEPSGNTMRTGLMDPETLTELVEDGSRYKIVLGQNHSPDVLTAIQYQRVSVVAEIEGWLQPIYSDRVISRAYNQGGLAVLELE